MAQDPYGFADSAAAEGDPESAASTALWTGIGALICGVAAPCCCYATYVVALPLSLVAIWQGLEGQKAKQAADQNSATAGIVAGGVSLVFSLIWLAFLALYVLYVAMVVLALGLGA